MCKFSQNPSYPPGDRVGKIDFLTYKTICDLENWVKVKKIESRLVPVPTVFLG